MIPIPNKYDSVNIILINGHSIKGIVDSWGNSIILKQNSSTFVIPNSQDIMAYEIQKSMEQIKIEHNSVEQNINEQIELPFEKEKPEKLAKLHMKKSALEKELLKKALSSHEVKITDPQLTNYKPFGIK